MLVFLPQTQIIFTIHVISLLSLNDFKTIAVVFDFLISIALVFFSLIIINSLFFPSAYKNAHPLRFFHCTLPNIGGLYLTSRTRGVCCVRGKKYTRIFRLRIVLYEELTQYTKYWFNIGH